MFLFVCLFPSSGTDNRDWLCLHPPHLPKDHVRCLAEELVVAGPLVTSAALGSADQDIGGVLADRYISSTNTQPVRQWT